MPIINALWHKFRPIAAFSDECGDFHRQGSNPVRPMRLI